MPLTDAQWDDLLAQVDRTGIPQAKQAKARLDLEYAEFEAEQYRRDNVWWRKVLNFVVGK